LSICVNLGILGFFKYFNFFATGLQILLVPLGLTIDYPTLEIVLPVGISFYTFQTMGYTIDVYRHKIRASRHPVEFFTFVCFFPQLIAGPIERAAKLLPQFHSARSLDYQRGKEGCLLILWGLFVKVVVADICGVQVDYIYDHISSVDAGRLIFGQFYFVIQLYGDFAGYSYIAIGVAKLFGFELSQNFNYPLFSRSIPEFWTRWHISLTKWFGDYLFQPLLKRTYRNRYLIFMTYLFVFVLVGLWHGPRITYLIAMGSLALYFIPRIFFGKRSFSHNRLELFDLPRIILTNIVLSFHLIFFRAENVAQASSYISLLFSKPFGLITSDIMIPLLPVICMFIIEWQGRTLMNPLNIDAFPTLLRWPVYFLFSYAVVNFLYSPKPYIYFQF